MAADDRSANPPPRSPAERRIARSFEEQRRVGALPAGSLERQRTVEGYLRAGAMPRWMESARDIHLATERHRRALAQAYAEERERHGQDAAAFAEAWRARAAAWSFEEVNDLIRQHNEWYPVERQLPWDSHTGDYVLISGRSYRRRELDEDWVLAQFPADPR